MKFRLFLKSLKLWFLILVVLLAYKGFGVDSYSWAILASALVGLPLYYLLSSLEGSFGFFTQQSPAPIVLRFGFSRKKLLAVIKDDLLTVFLTGSVGTAGVGYWGWAQKWAYSPFRLIVDSITK